MRRGSGSAFDSFLFLEFLDPDQQKMNADPHTCVEVLQGFPVLQASLECDSGTFCSPMEKTFREDIFTPAI